MNLTIDASVFVSAARPSEELYHMSYFKEISIACEKFSRDNTGSTQFIFGDPFSRDRN